MNDIKKNLLDLQFQKYLVIASTSFITAFTYIVGVFVALISKQISLKSWIIVTVLIGTSIAVLGPCILIFYKTTSHIKNILLILKSLRKELEKTNIEGR